MLEKVADTVLSTPLKITVDIIAKSRLQKKLQNWNIAPKQKVFEVHPVTLGSLIRISKLLLSIEIKEEDIKTKWQETSYNLMLNHSETVARIVATAITNKEKEPSQSLVDFILYNFTAKELTAVLSVVVQQMSIQDFIVSIVSVRALNVLESKSVPAKSAS